MKLLAKTAEERYQTAAGVEGRSPAVPRRMGGASAASTTFALGEHDTPDRLLIPEKLYGREREIATLFAAFDRVVDERHAGVGAGVRLFRHRQVVGRQRAAQGCSCRRAACSRPASSISTSATSRMRRSRRRSRASSAACSASSDAELARLARGARRRLGPNGRLIDRPCSRTEADHRRAAAGSRAAAASRRSVVFSWSSGGSSGVRAAGASARAFPRRLAMARRGHARFARGSAGAVRRAPCAGHRRLSEQRSGSRPSPRRARSRQFARRGRACTRSRLRPSPAGRGATSRGCAALRNRSVPRRSRGSSTTRRRAIRSSPCSSSTALADEGLLTFDHAACALVVGSRCASAPSVTPTTWRT